MKVVDLHLTKSEQRQLDNARESRFLSVDPLASSYPWYTPYQFAGNMPIKFIDLDGAEPYIPRVWGPSTQMMKMGAKEVEKKTIEFLKGLTKMGVAIIGLATQVPAAMEYGDKIPKEQWAQYFPLLPNNNIAKDLILPIFITPIELEKQLKENPTNGELWGETAGIILLSQGGRFGGMFKSAEFGLKVDLMGGEASRYGSGFIDFDKNAKVGIQDDVANFGNHFGKNTIKEMIVDNPQATFLNYVTDAMQTDGTVTIRGSMSNKYFNSIYNGKAEGLEGFEILSKKENITNPGYKQTGGKKPVKGAINEIVLKKKAKS